MEEKKIISIVEEDGSIDEAELVIGFELDEFKKKYLIYTKNETDSKGNITIYVSEMLEDEGDKYVLKSIDTDEEWDKIKEVLKEISKSDDQIKKEDEETAEKEKENK